MHSHEIEVCIIGGGQSGIVTCKTFVERNHQVLVLEKCNGCLGLFSTIPEKHYFKWSTSRHMSGFSDFPMDKKIPMWFTLADYVKYLQSYIDHFKLQQYFKYNSEVTSAKQLENGKWQIIYRHQGWPVKLIADKLIICTGLNQTPKFPKIINGFSGKVVHTEEIYRKMNRRDWKNLFQGKRVLLLGGGESALDIGHIITKYASKLYFTTKNYIEWFPQGGDSKYPDWMSKHENKCLHRFQPIYNNLNYSTDTMLSHLEYTLPTPMSGFYHEYVRAMYMFYHYTIRGIFNCTKCVHQHKKLCEINETPNSLFRKYVVKRDDFFLDLHSGKVEVVYYPQKIVGKTVIIEEEENLKDIDIIVCGTGYQKYFPFLSKEITKDKFIKNILPQHTSNLAFIGFARPTMGSIAAVAEMQGWWTELYFENKLKYHFRNYKWGRGADPLKQPVEHIDCLVIGCYYIKDLARDMNIVPNMVKLFFTDWVLFKELVFMSCHPMIYRLHGQFSYPGSREILLATMPKLEDRGHTELAFFTMFALFHISFIIITYIITRLVFKKLNFPLDYRFILFYLAFLIYTYTYWY